MSTDFDLCCWTCKQYHHLGQQFASGETVFGYGSNDAAGRRSAARFASEHLEHDLRVDIAPPEDFGDMEQGADCGMGD